MMDDVLEVEVLQSVFSSHWQMLARATAALWSRLLLLLESLMLFAQIHLLQPQAAALLIILCLLGLLINDRCFEWICSVIRWVRIHLPGRPVQNAAEALCGPTPPLEWRGRRAAAFAIQGQRSSMEDRFDAEEEIVLSGAVRHGRGVSIYGVYDGHGGDFAAEYTKKHLVAAIRQKLHEVHARRKPPSSDDESETDTADAPAASVGGGPSSSSLAKSSASGGASLAECSKSPSSGATSSEPANNAQSSGNVPSTSESKSASSEKDSAKSGDSTKTSTMQINVEPPSKSRTANSDKPKLNGDTLSPFPSQQSCKSHEAYRRSPRAARADAEWSDKLVNILGEVNYGRLMQDVFSEVDAALLDSARRQACIAGTTAVVALVDGDQVVVASCGDSRAVLCDARGNAVSLSIDHKPDQVSEKKRITEAGGFVTFNGVWRVNGVLATSRALGDLPFKERRLLTCRPDVQMVSVRHHAAPFLILASDGLWDTASAQEAVQHVRARLHEPDLAAKSLTLLAYQRGSQDNITVVVVDLRPGQVPRTGSFNRRTTPG